MTDKNQPLTVGLFEELFDKLFQKNFEKSFEKSFDKSFKRSFDQSFERKYLEMHEKVARPDFTKLLFQFYDQMIEPQFKEMRDFRAEFQEFKNESLNRFDDLYQKFESLEQEYIFSNHQLKRLDQETVKRDEFNELKERVDKLASS
ncbi:MAG: hypothetical protein KDK66_01805 [Deltaproteobacteria bacterium]|nr:hypothetical protein [Deltaproteobacteria bacterium]